MSESERKAENDILGTIVKNFKQQRIIKIVIVCLLEKSERVS